MATLSVPLTFEQHSPYIRGNITYLWYDTNAISAVSGGNASANGISSITTNLSATTTVIDFDSNASANVDIVGATSGLQFTVPDDYNAPITIEVTANIEVGQTHSATTLLTKTLRHSFDGISDFVFTASPADPTFTESDVLSVNRKSLGTFSVNDVDANAEYTATITYDKTIGSIDYANTDILTENSANDQVITSNVTLFNDTISNLDYLPLTVANGGDLESIQAQDVTIVVTSNVDSRVQNNSSTISVGVSTETEFAGIENITYVENTANTTVLPNLSISDTADSNVSTIEIYSVVVDPAQSLGNLNLNYTTDVEFYAGTGADSNISANAVIVQGPVANVNNALANAFTFYPDIEQTANTTFTVDLYRAPSGTAANLDINDNYGTFTKIFDSNTFTITNSATVDTLAISSNSVTMTEDDANVSLPSTTITADSRDTTNIDLTVGVTTTVPIGDGAGEFGNITSATGGTWSSSTGEFTYTGTQSQIDAVTANLVYNPGENTIADSTLTYRIQVQSNIYQKSANISITPVQETGNITVTTGNTIVYDSNNILTSPYEFGFTINDPDTNDVNSNITCNVSLSSNIGNISASAGTYDVGTRTWTYTDTLSNINTVTANMDLLLHSGTTTSANISIDYSDSQDPSGNVSVYANNVITVRDLDFDPVFQSTSTYLQDFRSIGPYTPTDSQAYVYVTTDQVDVYYNFDYDNRWWGAKDSYNISDLSNVTMTTTTANTVPFANVYNNYFDSGNIHTGINDGLMMSMDNVYDVEDTYYPSTTLQYIRGKTDGDRDSYWYLVPNHIEEVFGAHSLDRNFVQTYTDTANSSTWANIGTTSVPPNGGYMVGAWVGADDDVFYTTTAGSGSNEEVYFLSNTSVYGDRVTVNTWRATGTVSPKSSTSFYCFGDHTTTGNLVYVSGGTTSAPAKKTSSGGNQFKDTSGTVIDGHSISDDEGVLMVSGDDTTNNIVILKNELGGSYDKTTNPTDQQGYIHIIDDAATVTSGYQQATKSVQLPAGNTVVNQNTITFDASNPHIATFNYVGNKHFFYNNILAFIDNNGKLVIYKKN